MALSRLFTTLGNSGISIIEYYIDSTKDHPDPRLSWVESEQRMKWCMTDKGIPCTFFDGTDYLKGIPNTEGETTHEDRINIVYKSILSKVVEKSKKASPVTLNVESVYNSKHRTGKVHATVKAVDSIAYKDPHIYFALTESNIPYASVNGDKVHNFVLRDFVTPANDDELDYLGTPWNYHRGTPLVQKTIGSK